MVSRLDRVTRESVGLRQELVSIEAGAFDLEQEIAKIATRIYWLCSIEASGMFVGKLCSKGRGRLEDRRLQQIQNLLEVRDRLSKARLKARAHYNRNSADLYDAAIVDAFKKGIRINVDPKVILSAEWRDEHLAENDSNFSPIEKYNLDKITKEQLDANAKSYFKEAYDSLLPGEIEEAKEIILGIPLTHFMNDDMQVIGDDADSLHSHRSLTNNNIRTRSYYSKEDNGVSTLTFGTDIAMGLDNYVFMCLGVPYPNNRNDVKSRIILINPALLLKDGCLVTPTDIMELGEELNDFEGIGSDKAMDQAEKYFKSVVRGSDWVEILARRLAYWRKDNPRKPLEIESCFDFGEIKYKGVVPSSEVIGTITSVSELEDYKKALLTLPVSWPDNLFEYLNLEVA